MRSFRLLGLVLISAAIGCSAPPDAVAGGGFAVDRSVIQVVSSSGR